MVARPGGRRLRRAWRRLRFGRARRRLRLAAYWRARSDLDEAARHLDRAVALLETAPATPERDRLLAAALTALGNRHRRAACYPLAAAVLHRARLLLRDGDPLRAEVFMSLGILAKERGELDLAANWYARVAVIQDEAGASPADAAALAHNLAGLAYARERFADAEAHARRAVALRRRAPGSTDVDLAVERAVLGAALAAQHRYDEARALFGWALAACRRARPPRRYEIAVHLHHLAAIAHATGAPDEAQRLYREALALKRDLLGADHPEVELVAHNLGTLVADPLDRPA